MRPGECWVVEHKSTSEDIDVESAYWDSLLLDSQISNYLEGARALGFDPAGVLWDVIRKLSLEPYKATPLDKRAYTQPKEKACPDCKKKGGADTAPHTDEEGRTCAGGRIVTDPGGRLYANMRDRDETVDEYRDRCADEVLRNLDKYFRRRELVRLETDERESALDVWAIGSQIREATRLNRFPKTGSACRAFNRLCEYHGVCTGRENLSDETRFETTASHTELAAPRKHALPILSTSSAKAFQRCARFYSYAYVQRRRPRERSHALRWGTLIHIGLEAWWRTCDPEAAILAMHESAEGKLVDEWDLARAEVLLAAYHVRWSAERLRVEHVEVEFETPLVNPATGAPSKTWVRGGKLDAVATAA